MSQITINFLIYFIALVAGGIVGGFVNYFLLPWRQYFKREQVFSEKIDELGQEIHSLSLRLKMLELELKSNKKGKSSNDNFS